MRILGAGPRVVLLHGGPGLDHHVLVPLAEELADVYEVWLPDLPGHGAHATRQRPGLSETVERLERWLLSLGGAVDVLAGHSLGAFLVRELLRRGNLRPGAAVLLAPPAGDPARGRLGWPRVPKERRATVDAIRRGLLAEVTRQTGAPPSERFVECVGGARLAPPTSHEALLRGLGLALSQPTPRCRPGCPVLVLSGAEDPIVTPHQASVVAAATAGATLATVPGVGHVPAATASDGTSAAIRDFLAAQLRR